MYILFPTITYLFFHFSHLNSLLLLFHTSHVILTLNSSSFPHLDPLSPLRNYIYHYKLLFSFKPRQISSLSSWIQANIMPHTPTKFRCIYPLHPRLTPLLLFSTRIHSYTSSEFMWRQSSTCSSHLTHPPPATFTTHPLPTTLILDTLPIPQTASSFHLNSDPQNPEKWRI